MSEIVISGVGAQTPVGLSLPASAAAVRAGIGGFRSSEWLAGRNGEPLVVAELRALSPQLPRRQRMEAMIASAVSEALGGASRPLQPAPETRWCVALALPEDDDTLSDMAIAAVEAALAAPLHECSVFRGEHAIGLTALAQACHWLDAKTADECLVVAADSQLDLAVVRQLEIARRLKLAAQPDGFIVGEAASALRISSRRRARSVGLPSMAAIVRHAVSHEPQRWKDGQGVVARGLTELFHDIIGPPQPARSGALGVYCDLNGEPWRGHEWALSQLRTLAPLGRPLNLYHPADCWGDAGAASAVLLVALAAWRLSRAGEDGQDSLIWAASPQSGRRAAALLQRA